MAARYLSLNNGYKIPVLGLGTYRSAPTQATQAVKDAIDVGYRHIDCAWFYQNEHEVGQGIRAKIEDGTVRREELFVTDKLWNNFHAPELVAPMLRESLKNLGLDYLDLFLIHWPMGFKEDAPIYPTECGPEIYSNVDYVDTWRGMEECVKLGLTKSIGLSNFNSQQLDRVLQNCVIKPVVNQIECNANINQRRLIKFCADRNVVVTGFCPLGRIDYYGRSGVPEPAVLDSKVIRIAKRYKRTPAQIVLNFLVSLGICVIPKSVNRRRIEENSKIFDFALQSEDVAYLKLCSKNFKVSTQSKFKDHKYHPFTIEF